MSEDAARDQESAGKAGSRTLRSRLLPAARSIGAVITGFAVVTLGTIFTFTVLVDDFGYYTSGLAELVIGACGAAASGLAGGAVAGWLAARKPLQHAAALALPIALDTASIVAAAGPGSDPLWFDLGGSATLLASAVVGGWMVARRRSSAAVRLPPSG